MNYFIETERLLHRQFQASDSSFIIRLLNSPGWLEFIGDRNVRTETDAIAYINSLQKAYQQYGFGFYAVVLKDSLTPIGLCGLIKRDYMEEVDIGFAFLPEFVGKGYGYESANAIMDYAASQLKISPVVAITDEHNKASIALLEKLGLRFKKMIVISKEEAVMLFTPQ